MFTCGVHEQSPVWIPGRSGASVFLEGGDVVLLVVLVVVGLCLAAAAGAVAGGLYVRRGVVGAHRRRLDELQDDVEALSARLSRREKREASEKGVAARTAMEEVRDLIAAGVHRETAPAAAAAPPPLDRRSIVRAARARRASPTLNGAAEE